MRLTIECLSRYKNVDNIEIDTTYNLYKADKDYFVDCVMQNNEEYVAGKYVARFNEERISFEVKNI
jgi:hypothetical protein